ncbi:MFS transporter [Dissulfurirhabdus thermomarina]|uniref:MFS transporter n=1 Tax=Dissulfurirhabdus thermomarina TaxID=1765737 RepID=UPI0014708572|nr:MFS transporter [Dissulfurirhabdus thermomarina]NMX24091.1 MFS transporter [Dissulfurirhabdus thermomarina]
MGPSSWLPAEAGRRRVILGWAAYDWANSAYATTVAAAVLPVYFAAVVVPPGGVAAGGTRLAAETLWGLLSAGSALVVFALAPVLGAVADFRAAKRPFLLAFCLAGAAAVLGLASAGPGDTARVAAAFVLAQVGFVGANVFYDAFLPVIARREERDRVSSLGYAAGYLGGGLHFGLSLLVVAFHHRLGLAAPAAARLVMASAALWWAGFALAAAGRLPEGRRGRRLPPALRRLRLGAGYAVLGLRRVGRTLRRLRRLPNLLLFLAAFFAYNDGIQTVVRMAAIYGRQELGLAPAVLMGALLVAQATALAGSLAFGALAGRVGAKLATLATLAVWVAAAGLAAAVEGAAAFVALGALFGAVLGGSQALSRSLYAGMVPAGAEAEFFAFYGVTARLSAVWGPFFFAVIRHATGSSRLGIASVLALLLLGMALLSRVDPAAARREARGAAP